MNYHPFIHKTLIYRCSKTISFYYFCFQMLRFIKLVILFISSSLLFIICSFTKNNINNNECFSSQFN